jgi:uncharacterized protein YbgA (DUF1722 family)/uncharacterized protein YbbK (DUF523 family)
MTPKAAGRDARTVDTHDSPLRLGVSACLLGETVRYDGGHKRDAFLADTLGPLVEWVPVCPEVESGMGTPRPSMRLVGAGGRIRLLTVGDGRDLTLQLQRYSVERVGEIAKLKLDGYVLKKDSPSCGLFRVKVYATSGPAARSGRGLFSKELCDALPLLPVEEEGRLCDPRLRENFVERVFAYRRLRVLLESRPSVADVVRFHTRHKLILLAHSPAAYVKLGRLVATVKKRDAERQAMDYASHFMTALEVVATRGRHSNVLQHMAGYFRGLVDEASRAELGESIADYQRGLLPLVVPITLIAHHARRHDVRYLLDQVYLQPHPKELMLRNHV